MKITQQQHDNLKLALRKWQEVPPEEVVRGLRVWTCGTQACFGGHLVTWPEFQEQGVRRAWFEPGAPRMVDGGYILTPAEVAYALFGSSDLFDVRGMFPSDENCFGSDHDVVTNRLVWLLDRAEVVG